MNPDVPAGYEPIDGISPYDDDPAFPLHRNGKMELRPTVRVRDNAGLALAYTPGVGRVSQAIADDPSLGWQFTWRSNTILIVTDGTAVLGLGDIGPLAALPVMEGKSLLFKEFGGVDCVPICLDTQDVDEIVETVVRIAPAYGGINLEDISAPRCFEIEERLKQALDIPVFHDDQHGTAIIAAAGLLNALHLTGRKIDTFKLVVNGAGAAGIACLELLGAMGMPKKNVIFCDTKGVIYEGRTEGMNQWKSAYAAKTKARTLAEALKGADAFFGLSAAGAVTQAMVKSMADKPIIFAMANPDPEITPEDVAEVRPDAIVATGRSDYPNQINNVLGFPFIFRGALDVQASTINDAMKIAAAKALAELAREDVPDQVAAAFLGRQVKYGADYIIPAPFDPRLISRVAPAVAKAAMETGVARRPIVDMEGYVSQLSGRLDPVAGWLQAVFTQVRANPKRIIFAEGEQTQIVRAANSYHNMGLGTPILIGRKEPIKEAAEKAGIKLGKSIAIHDTSTDPRNADYAEFLYARLQRKGYLLRDCQRLVTNDRNVFAACMVAMGHADGMVTGVTRNWTTAYEDVRKVLDARASRRVIGVSIVLIRGRAVLVADVSVHDMPDGNQLADITEEVVRVARRLSIEPRVALLAYSNFGQPKGERTEAVREAVSILDRRQVDFEYEGDMSADVALNRENMKQYPFCRLSDTANVLVMPAFHSASISTKMLQELGGATLIGPMLVGLTHSVQICPLGAKDSDVVNMAALAAYDING